MLHMGIFLRDDEAMSYNFFLFSQLEKKSLVVFKSHSQSLFPPLAVVPLRYLLHHHHHLHLLPLHSQWFLMSINFTIKNQLICNSSPIK